MIDFLPRRKQELHVGPEVRRMPLNDGDAIIVHLDRPATKKRHKMIIATLSSLFPGHPIVVCDPGVEITTMGIPS